VGICRGNKGDNIIKNKIVIGIAILSLIYIAGITTYALYFLPKDEPLIKNETKPQIIIQLKEEENAKIEFVSATEYSFQDEKGMTIVKLSDNQGDWINTSCYETILNPDKSFYLNWTPMIPQPEYANYYLNFSVPRIEGIFDQEVFCEINNKNISLGKGFHVGNSNILSNISNAIEEMSFGESYG